MNQPNSFSLDALYDLYSMEDRKAQATNEGRREVVERIRQTQARGPAVGAVTGAPEQKRTFAEEQANDVLKAMKQNDPLG
jgi:major membrane immunogen (membrane-anchored lipoprotein)